MLTNNLRSTVRVSPEQLHSWMTNGALTAAIVDGTQQRFTGSATAYMWDAAAFNRLLMGYNQSQSVQQFFAEEIASMRGLMRNHYITKQRPRTREEKDGTNRQGS